MRLYKKICVFVFCVFFGQMTLAQIFQGPISSALGGAGRASVEPAEGFYINPAAVIHYRSLTMGLWSGHSRWEGASFRYQGFTFTDNSPGILFPGGLGYLKSERDFAGVLYKDQNFNFATGGFIFDKMAIGVGFEFIKHNTPDDDYQQGAFHIGFLYTPIENLGLALVGMGVSRTHTIPIEAIKIPTSWAFGVHYLYKEVFRVLCDVQYFPEAQDDQQNIYMFGLETLPLKWTPIRFGYQRSELEEDSFWSMGIGLNSPRLRINYALQQGIEDSSNKRHIMDLVVPF